MVQPLRVKWTVKRVVWRVIVMVARLPIFPDAIRAGRRTGCTLAGSGNDPRLNEIVSHLNHVVEEARSDE